MLCIGRLGFRTMLLGNSMIGSARRASVDGMIWTCLINRKRASDGFLSGESFVVNFSIYVDDMNPSKISPSCSGDSS